MCLGGGGDQLILNQIEVGFRVMVYNMLHQLETQTRVFISINNATRIRISKSSPVMLENFSLIATLS